MYHFPVPNSHFCFTMWILINVKTVHTKLTSAADKYKHRCNFKWCKNVKTVTFKSDRLYKRRALGKLHLHFHPVKRHVLASVSQTSWTCVRHRSAVIYKQTWNTLPFQRSTVFGKWWKFFHLITVIYVKVYFGPNTINAYIRIKWIHVMLMGYNHGTLSP